MDMKKSKRFLLGLAGIYWVFVILLYLIANAQFRSTPVSGIMLSPANALGEITDDITLTQRFQAPAEQLTSLDVYTGTFSRQNTGTITFLFRSESGEEVAWQDVDVSAFRHMDYTSIPLEQTADIETGDLLTLSIFSRDCTPGNAVTIFYGSTLSAGKVEVPQDIAPEDLYVWNGEPGAGSLCIRINGLQSISFYQIYWIIAVTLFLAVGGYTWNGYRKALQGRPSGVAAICTLFCRYQFLLQQLVTRDFKTKYKRSVLGMAWSLLNPLLTMAVQYVVFSTLFKSTIPHYHVYLLTGTVLFNFFSESVSQGMMSIVANASLIKKVYMPKYIYPLSKLFSSLINLGLAMIPLALVMLVTGTPIRLSILLLVFDILCLMCFALGMILLLSTAMTFFQDTQFLWGVASMLWMYLTPIFYPETIIPANLLPLYRMNPMYQYISFARTCIIDGISPQPAAYFWCLLSALAVLLLGIFTFRRHQDKFVLYL